MDTIPVSSTRLTKSELQNTAQGSKSREQVNAETSHVVLLIKMKKHTNTGRSVSSGEHLTLTMSS